MGGWGEPACLYLYMFDPAASIAQMPTRHKRGIGVREYEQSHTLLLSLPSRRLEK
jgi:hypothetical protein